MKTTILALALASAFAHSHQFRAICGGEDWRKFCPWDYTEDGNFHKEAATSDMLEIEAGKVAQQKGDADEKKFAEQMMTDHTKTSSELKRSVPSRHGVCNTDFARRQAYQKKLDKLRNAKADDFARDYDPMQVSAHKDAVSLFERYATARRQCQVERFGPVKLCRRCNTICRWPN